MLKEARCLKKFSVATSDSAYTAGDQVGALTRIESVSSDRGGLARLESMTLVDVSKTKAELIVLFFSSDPGNASADKETLAVSPQAMASKFVGSVHIESEDYVDTAQASVVSLKNINLLLKTEGTRDRPSDLYALVMSVATPDFQVDGDTLFFGLGIVAA